MKIGGDSSRGLKADAFLGYHWNTKDSFYVTPTIMASFFGSMINGILPSFMISPWEAYRLVANNRKRWRMVCPVVPIELGQRIGIP